MPIPQLSELEYLSWYTYLSSKQRQLIETSLVLLDQARQHVDSQVSDYSYLVFPTAKAYEGFIKRYFHQMGLISEEDYTDKYFRIGRALNPDIRPRFRDKSWLYDNIAQQCGSQIARQLWETWLAARNRLFHYFPGNNTQMISLVRAEHLLEQVFDAMNQAIICQVSTT